RVQVNPGALASMGLSLEQVRTAIQQATQDRAKGSLDGPAQTWAIAANDQLVNADQFRPVIVGWRNGAPIRLGEVANGFDSVANSRVAGWFNTSNAVVVRILKQPQANMASTVDRVKEVLPELENWMPPSIKTVVTSDRTIVVRRAIHDVKITFALTTTLVI